VAVQASLTDLLLAGGALLLTLGVGTVVHEFAHAAVLWTLGVPFDVEWLPDREEAGPAGAGFFGRWASVTPRRLPPDLSPWGLRAAALAPLVLAAPMALVLVGVLPDPNATGNLPLIVATLTWFGCALPSPQDFSLVWHADAAIEEHSGSAP
jgi:hypothetical protein